MHVHSVGQEEKERLEEGVWIATCATSPKALFNKGALMGFGGCFVCFAQGFGGPTVAIILVVHTLVSTTWVMAREGIPDLQAKPHSTHSCLYGRGGESGYCLGGWEGCVV